MIQDTLVVITAGKTESPDLLPLWTGLLGGVLGVAATWLSAHYSLRATQKQIDAQRDLAKTDLQQQATHHREQLMGTLVAAHRAKSIEQLQQEVAAYCATVLAIITDIEANVPESVWQPKVDRSQQHMALINLIVDLDNQSCASLVAELEAFGEFLNKWTREGTGDADQATVQGHLNRAADHTRQAVAASWARVRSLE